MPIPIPETHRDLIEGPVVVIIASIMPSGGVHSSAVWRRYDGEYVLITTETKNQKYKNLRHNPHVSIMALDPTNTGRYLELRGVVEALETEGVLAEVDRQTLLYTGKAHYYGDIESAEKGEEYDGVIIRMKITKVVTS